MFLGTQGDLIAMIAETRAEIIETNEPVKMVDGKYYIEAENIFSKN